MGELVEDVDESAQRSREAVDAVDEQDVELAGLGGGQGALETGPLEGGARLLILINDSGELPAGLDVGSRRFCQRRLLTLTRHRAITRFRPFKLDGGTHPFHYLIDQLGADLIAAQRGEDLPRGDTARQRRIHLTSRANLPHLLGVNQSFIDLAAHARTHPPAQLRQWWPASRFRDRGWVLDFTGDRGAVLRETPLPDGYGLWAQDGTVVAFFLEFDRGTETLGVLAGKVRRYANLEYEVPVLFLLPSAERELNLHAALSQRLPDLAAMVVTTAQDILTYGGLGPAGPVWWLHGDQGPRLRLADLPPSPKHLIHLSAVSRKTATTQRA